MKRLHVLPFLAALILVLCCVLPTEAEAATSGYYTYTVSGGKATITDCDTSISGNVTIPSTLGGYPVTSIGYYAFDYCSSLTSVTIPDSVTSIGNCAFYYCSSLTSVTIPDSVTSIGNFAFYKCSSLTSVTIPDSVTSIGYSAFYDCIRLTGITIPDSVTSMGDSVFEGCRSLTSVTIGDGVTEIGYKMFYGCSNLTSVTFSEDIESIGHYAFYNCRSLKSITIPKRIRSIGNYTFTYCSSLCDFIIADDVTSIGEYAYCGCSSIKALNIPDSVVSIGDYAFSGWLGLTENITIPDSVVSIGNYAFEGCSYVKSVTIGKGVTKIGEEAFKWCSNLEKVYISDIKAWCNISFGSTAANPISQTRAVYLNGELIEKLILPEGITSISSYAFSGWNSLTEITIPEGVTSIGGGVFSGCKKLTNVVVPNSVTVIDGSAFSDCIGLSGIIIPDGVIAIGREAFNGCDSLVEINIPDSVKTIGQHAFSGCDSLLKVSLGNGITDIGGSAFSGCDRLRSINIPEGVITISDSTFRYCSQLTDITIPNSVTGIGAYAFYNCSSLKSVYYGGDQESWEQITIGSYNSPLRNATIHFQHVAIGGGNQYGTLAKAVAATEEGGLLQLTNDITEDATIGKTVCIDLNGFDINGTITVANGCTLYCFDSKTDDYTVNDADGYGKITKIEGKVQGLPQESDLAEDGYLLVKETDGISFHRVTLRLTAMSLRASRVGVYYKSYLAGDELVADRVQSFGVALSVVAEPNEANLKTYCGYSSFTNFENATTMSTLLKDIMKSDRTAKENASRAAMPIYGSAYILTTDGQYMFGAAASRSLQQQVEEADAMWDQLDATQQAELIGMYQRYADAMQSWELPNLQTAISNPAAILPGKEELAA